MADTSVKCVIFRIPEDLKRQFKIALLKNGIDLQHTCESFAEAFIAYTNGDKQPGDVMKAIVKRSQTLTMPV